MKIPPCIQAGIAGLFFSTGALADAGELSIFHTIGIEAPADVVWETAGDFGGIQRWAPGTELARLFFPGR